MQIDINISLSLSRDTKQFVESLAAAYQHNIGHKLQNIMSTISDFAVRVNEHNTAIDLALEGVTADVDELKKLIEKLQNTPGQVTPEDQKLLDEIEAKIASTASRLTALDELTPPVVPSP